MRVAADQLLAAVLGDLRQRPGAALLEQQRQEVDLEEDVAELVEQLGVVAGVGGVGELVGLLERVRDDRALVLLAVPGALAAQAPGQLVQPRDGLRRAVGQRRPLAGRGRRCGLGRAGRAGASGVVVFGALKFLQTEITSPLRQPSSCPLLLEAGHERR